MRRVKIMVLGDGVVGQHAALAADSLGANVYHFGRSRTKYQAMEKLRPNMIMFVEFGPDSFIANKQVADALGLQSHYREFAGN